MARHSYVSTTTTRYLAWRKERANSSDDSFTLDQLLEWLRVEEQYARPVDALRALARDLRIRFEDSPEELGRELHILFFKVTDEYQELVRFKSKVEEVYTFIASLPRRLGLDDL